MRLTFNYPVGDHKTGTEIVKKDLKCLGDSRLINDKIMDLCLKHYFLEEANPMLREKTELFSSLFYSSVSSEAFKQRNQPSGWTKNLKNPFENDFLVVPLADSGHWVLAIICYAKIAHEISSNNSQSNTVGGGNLLNGNSKEVVTLPSSSNSTPAATPRYRIPLKRKLPGSGGPITPLPDNQSTRPVIQPCRRVNQHEPMILLLDSLHVYKDICRGKIAQNLRLFLTLEWKKRYPEIPFTFTKENIPICVPKVSQQKNIYDCGVYAIHFFECFFKKSPIKPFKIPLQLGNEWYDVKNIKTGAKREELYQTIKNLMRKHSSPLLEGLPSTTAPFANLNQSDTGIEKGMRELEKILFKPINQEKVSSSTPAFSGQGYRLGLGTSDEVQVSSSQEEDSYVSSSPESLTPTNGHSEENTLEQSQPNSNDSSPQKMEEEIDTPPPVDSFETKTKVMVRLTNGNKEIIELKRTDPVYKIREKLCASHPDLSYTPFVLIKGNPPAEPRIKIEDENVTIEESQIGGSIIIIYAQEIY